MRKVVCAIAFVMFLATSLVAPLHAMEIYKFDRMATADQKEYVIGLVEGAQKVLREEGHADLAKKVARLFTTKDPQGKISIGMTQFEIALAKARVADAKNAARDPQAVRLEVEDAMAGVMDMNGIDIPDSFFAVMKDLKPKDPPKQSGTASDPTPPNAKKQPMITQNSDGTITVQKEPSKEEVKNATVKEGLVIPPQVVIPIVPAPKKRN